MTDNNTNPESSPQTGQTSSHQARHSLIETLQQLLLQVSHKMRYLHLSHSQMGKVRESIDIWEKLETHLENIPPTDSAEHRPQIGDSGQAIQGNSKSAEVLISNELGEYYYRESSSKTHPHMSDVMQHKTMEHISLSLHQARQGNKDGARLHIELAESAMRTASQFMPSDAYQEFKISVEAHLESIIKNRHS